MPDVELLLASRFTFCRRANLSDCLAAGYCRSAGMTATANIHLWDDYFAPGYGVPNDAGMEAVKLLASTESAAGSGIYR